MGLIGWLNIKIPGLVQNSLTTILQLSGLYVRGAVQGVFEAV
jgi:hypothetical protein